MLISSTSLLSIQLFWSWIKEEVGGEVVGWDCVGAVLGGAGRGGGVSSMGSAGGDGLLSYLSRVLLVFVVVN